VSQLACQRHLDVVPSNPNRIANLSDALSILQTIFPQSYLSLHQQLLQAQEIRWQDCMGLAICLFDE